MGKKFGEHFKEMQLKGSFYVAYEFPEGEVHFVAMKCFETNMCMSNVISEIFTAFDTFLFQQRIKIAFFFEDVLAHLFQTLAVIMAIRILFDAL